MLARTAEKILADVKEGYDRISDEFSGTRQYGWKDFEFWKKYLKRGWQVIDCGCGNGRLVDFLEQFQVNYVGVDVSKKLISAAKKKISETNFSNCFNATIASKRCLF